MDIGNKNNKVYPNYVVLKIRNTIFFFQKDDQVCNTLLYSNGCVKLENNDRYIV